MASYDLIQEFTDSDNPDSITTSPAWVIAVIRLKERVTFSRSTFSSASKFSPDAVITDGPPLIIRNDCTSMQIANMKGNHISTLNAGLIQGNRNYLTLINPGDWVLAWIVNFTDKADKIVFNLKNGLPCNDWDSGLKFIGRVDNISKQVLQNPGGSRSAFYNLTAKGFGEFDSQIFYEPHLAAREKELSTYFASLDTSINNLIAENGNGISTNKIIPGLLDLLLGRGVPYNFKIDNQDPRSRATFGLSQSSPDEPPFAYIVPKEVGNIIGKTEASKKGGVMSYADLLDVVYGIQRYSSSGLPQNLFNPDGTLDKTGNRRFTDIPMSGEFIPDIPHFVNAPVWSVLNQYLNPVINEMYTTLRVNPQGKIAPTLVIRQMPFTSDKFDPTKPRKDVPKFQSFDPNDIIGDIVPSLYIAPQAIQTTPFLELPRWKIHPLLVKSASVSKSEALRFNFVHGYGQSPMPASETSVQAQIIRNPPIRDDQDIKRSGLHPYNASVACSLRSIQNNTIEQWMKLVADFVMGQHLSLTGAINMYGIDAPICIGDNIEWDGIVLHIEQVTHSCSIVANGTKTFTTSLAVTHGYNANPTREESSMYAGLEPEDFTTYDPGVTVEGEEE